MDNKRRLMNLNKILSDLTNKMMSSLPKKHAGRERQYREFLAREIATVQKTIESMKK